MSDNSFNVDPASMIVTPTMHYRWFVRFEWAGARVLQQAFRRSDGEIEWRDVPVVVEPEPLPRGGSHAE
jgi:hypothetical protein